MPPINALDTVGKFDLYNIPLRSMEIGKREFEYHLNNDFFEKIDGEEFQKGDVSVVVKVNKTPTQSELTFELEGKIVVQCDRCLEEMNLPIKTQGHLIVKMGKEYSDDGEEVVFIPEEQGVINVSWFMYEFISLVIPLKHVHPYGLCNKDMSKKLREHIAVDNNEPYEEQFIEEMENGEDFIDDEESEPSNDPRWDVLRNLK